MNQPDPKKPVTFEDSLRAYDAAYSLHAVGCNGKKPNRRAVIRTGLAILKTNSPA